MSPGKEPKGEGQRESKDEALVVVGSTSHPFSYDAQRDKRSNGARKKGSFYILLCWQMARKQKQKPTSGKEKRKGPLGWLVDLFQLV